MTKGQRNVQINKTMIKVKPPEETELFCYDYDLFLARSLDVINKISPIFYYYQCFLFTSRVQMLESVL